MLSKNQGGKIMRFNVISKKKIPTTDSPHSKWRTVFTELKDNKAIELEFDNDVASEKARSTLLGCFRYERQLQRDWEFHLVTRKVRRNGKIFVYAYKEKNK